MDRLLTRLEKWGVTVTSAYIGSAFAANCDTNTALGMLTGMAIAIQGFLAADWILTFFLLMIKNGGGWPDE